ncbi:MAG: ABC transporter permease [Anaerolineae bacterium]|nr:ABC transporter permease [Anaerolineae bacterium]
MRKEFRHIGRDGRMLFLVTVAPAFLLLLLSYVFSLDVERITIAVRDLDRTPLSREFIARLTADGDIVVAVQSEEHDDPEALFRRGAVDAVLTIPQGFAAALLKGHPAEVQCVVDGADAIMASQFIGLLESRVSAFGARLRGSLDRGIEVSSRAWYNETLKSLVSMVPGMMAVILCMPALALALALTKEKETGSFEGLIATPVRGSEYLIGKLAAYTISGLGSAIPAWLVATLWFRVPFRGNLLEFFLLTADYLFASMGISLVVSSLVKNQQTAMFLILTVFFIPSFFIAGLILPVSNEPLMRAIAYLLPTTHFITISRGLFLKGLSLEMLTRQALVLAMLGWCGLLSSLALFSKKLK